MTPEQLNEIEKLAGAATPGPWEPYIGVDFGLTMAEYYACGPYHASHEFDETSPSIVSDGKERAEADAALIRAMREYALPLVKALREAWAALDEREGDMHARIRAGYDKTVADSWRTHCAKIEKERDVARARLSNLLARIHRDGGHYEVENGTEKATEDAEKIVVEDRQAYVSWRDTALATAQERDEARAAVTRLTHNLVQTERHAQLVEMSLADSRAEVERLKARIAELEQRS